MTKPNKDADAAYLRSPARLKFIRALTERLNKSNFFAADDPSRQGPRADHTYSLTRELMRTQSRETVA